MRTATVLLVLGGMVMAAAIVYGFVAGGFIEEAKTLFGYPWFQVAMIDLYVGFFLFAGWIAFREQSRGVAVAWIIALCLLGNFVSCIYAARALVHARGDWSQFWTGKTAN